MPAIVTSSASTRAALSAAAVTAIGEALRPLLADVFVLYLKTKNFHWHVRGAHFRDYHLLFDEQAAELLAMTDDMAERARKLGAPTLRSAGDIVRHQRLADNDDTDVPAGRMLAELQADNDRLADFLRETHTLCDRHGDIATASLIETWVDEAERRSWFLRDTAAATPAR